MSPTVKDSSTLSNGTETAEREPLSASQETNGPQPVTLQVPVTVNGARAVEGSQKREPFSENTNTVLVLVNGAVIKLATPVTPGQLLFLTNDRTRKEVVCQVVKSKNDRSASGYVELQFTEPVLGFWGMRFPGERQGGAVRSVAPNTTRKAEAAPALPAIPAVTVVEAKPERQAEAVQPVTPAAKIAEVTPEFKTEIKADARPSSKADFLAPSGTSEGLDNNRLQEQLSALLFAEQRQAEAKPVEHEPVAKQELEEVAAKIFEIAAEPAAKLDETEVIVAAPPAAIVPVVVPEKSAAPAASSFDEEVVKIPAWLEPLARNASIPAPPENEQSGDISGSNEEWASPEATAKPEATPKQTAVAARNATEETKRPAAPVFSKTLLDEGTSVRGKRQGSGKGMWMAIAAAVLAAAAGGGWYFRDALAGLLPGSGGPEANVAAAVLPAAPENSAAPAALSVPDSAPKADRASSSSVKEEAPVKVTSSAAGKMQTAAITERVPRTGSSTDAIKSAENPIEAVQPENKKMGLGEVHLAKPKVERAAKATVSGEMEPSLDASSQLLPGGESSLNAGFAEGAKQPVAPAAEVRAGGDVKPARMISSVPPVYPAMAKTQHISGDVKVDALIDATGRVTTMKVVSGPTLLHQAAMDALRQWKYQAASLDGQAVPMHLTVTIQFRLQ